MLNLFLSIPRYQKRIVSVFVDFLLISFAFWCSYWVRLDGLTPIQSTEHWVLLAFLAPLTGLGFVKLGLYRAVLRYLSFRVLLTVLAGVIFSTVLLVTSAFYFNVFLPRSTSILYFSFALILIGGVRLFFRMVVHQMQGIRIPVLIYGAGASGRQLQLALNYATEFMPVAFIDDDPKLLHSTIQGLAIHSPKEIERFVDRYKVEKILLAMPSASRNRRQQVLTRLESLPCEVLSIPSTVDLVTGQAKIDELKEVSINDLLGRDAISPQTGLMQKNIKGQVVLVTGAGGSIGSELCRQIIRLGPKSLILFDHSEFSLYEIDKELNNSLLDRQVSCQIIPIIGSVQNKSRITGVMKNSQVNTVYHAAAYKHVPLVEYNVVEGVRNNIFGTINCALAALDAGVDSFVLISTDKAVRPTNVMGASKRIAELVLQALADKQRKTIFTMVRFGNVLGSSGSVIPLFRRQILRGGPVTVTHEEMVRYFMTIPEASQLVIQAGAMGRGGDVFVLDMGQPVKILELAQRMIRLTGLTVKDEQNIDGDIEIQITGLRPGEKLYEELLIGDAVEETRHPRIMTANEVHLNWPETHNLLSRLDKACHKFHVEDVIELLLEAPAAFNKQGHIPDWVLNAKT